MYVWHLGGSVALESDGVHADMDVFEGDDDDDELLPEDLVLVDELEALLDWVWDSYWPCGVYVNQDERDELPDRFNAWHESLGRTADGSLLTVVTFRVFGRWFLDLHQHFVYIRRHEAATDIVILEQHEEEDGDIFSVTHQEHTTVTSLHSAGVHQAGKQFIAPQKHALNPRLFDSQKSNCSAVTFASDVYESKCIDFDDDDDDDDDDKLDSDYDDDDIDEVHVYRGVEEDQHTAERDVLRSSQKVRFDAPKSLLVVGKKTLIASQKSAISESQKSAISAVTFESDYQQDSDDDVDDDDNNNISNLWGELCDTCADFDDDHIEDSITGEPGEETEAWQRYALHLLVDDDDRHAEECIIGDDVDKANDGGSDDGDDFKALASEKDKYAEDCIADVSDADDDDDDDDDDHPLPTEIKVDPRVAKAPIATLSMVSVAVGASVTRSLQQKQKQKQKQKQQMIPVQQAQHRQADSESMNAGNAVVKIAASPPKKRTIEVPPVALTADDAIIDVVAVVVPPPPPASPSLTARSEPLPLPLAARASREIPSRVDIPLRRVVVQPMQEETTLRPVDVTIGGRQVGTADAIPPSTSTVTATTTSSSSSKLHMPNEVEVSETEDDENLVDISELYNLWGGTGGYDIPLTGNSVPRFSEKFEYEDEEDVNRGR